jgi:hypothetical protein
MPTQAKRDHDGTYYQWGNHGHHYYYGPGTNMSAADAKKAANAQAGAAYANGYRGK